MRVKEEHLDKHISCPFTGKTYWVREMDTKLYPFFYNKGYQWLFESDFVETIDNKKVKNNKIK